MKYEFETDVQELALYALDFWCKFFTLERNNVELAFESTHPNGIARLETPDETDTKKYRITLFSLEEFDNVLNDFLRWQLVHSRSIHELLHIKYPDDDEDEIINRENVFIEWYIDWTEKKISERSS